HADPAFAMPRQVMHYLTTAGGMAHMNGIFQVQMGGNSRQVVGIMVHIVAAVGLTGAAVAAAIVGDNPIPMIQEEQHLVIPIVRAQRPTVTEHNRLSGPPILVENCRAVFHRDRTHSFLSPSLPPEIWLGI